MKNFLSIRSKYHNHAIKVNGERFASKKEFLRWCQLLEMQEQGLISDLRRQVKFALIPAQRETETVTPRGKQKPGKVIEREVAYYADFCYKDSNGELVVEDTKGIRTDAYILKRKMLLWFKGIRIREI